MGRIVVEVKRYGSEPISADQLERAARVAEEAIARELMRGVKSGGVSVLTREPRRGRS